MNNKNQALSRLMGMIGRLLTVVQTSPWAAPLLVFAAFGVFSLELPSVATAQTPSAQERSNDTGVNHPAKQEQKSNPGTSPAPKVVLRSIENPQHQSPGNHQGSYEIDLEPLAQDGVSQRMKLTIPASVREIEIYYPTSDTQSLAMQTAGGADLPAQATRSALTSPSKRLPQVKTSEKNYASLSFEPPRMLDPASVANEVVAGNSQLLQPLVPMRNVKVVNPFFQPPGSAIPERPEPEISYQDTGLPAPQPDQPARTEPSEVASAKEASLEVAPNSAPNAALSNYQESPMELPYDCDQAEDSPKQPVSVLLSDSSTDSMNSTSSKR